VNGNNLVGETAEIILGIVGNVRSIRIMIAICNIVLAGEFFIT